MAAAAAISLEEEEEEGNLDQVSRNVTIFEPNLFPMRVTQSTRQQQQKQRGSNDSIRGSKLILLGSLIISYGYLKVRKNKIRFAAHLQPPYFIFISNGNPFLGRLASFTFNLRRRGGHSKWKFFATSLAARPSN